jgi:hypothetical protein
MSACAPCARAQCLHSRCLFLWLFNRSFPSNIFFCFCAGMDSSLDASKKRPIEEGGAGVDRSKRANLGENADKPSAIKV